MLLVMEMMEAVVVPVLVTVTVCAWVVAPTDCVPNASEVGLTVNTPPTTTPVPESVRICGELFAVLLMVSKPGNVAAEVGVKVTPN